MTRPARRWNACAVAALLAGCAFGGGVGGDEAASVAQEPARVRVELFGGFPAAQPPFTEGRVALVVESTDAMARASDVRTPLVRAARAAALRFARALPADTDLSLVVVGNAWDAGCGDPASHYGGERSDVTGRISRLRARGNGSLAAALDDLASPEEGGYARVVAITSLRDGCGDDLCRVIEALPARGVRLDLVVLGDAQVPSCVDRATAGAVEASTPPWASERRKVFHVESAGPDPAVLVCGESGGLPVVVPPGRANVVVKLDPPLRVQRNFLPGTRWVLQVLDFPGLDPPERQWRWAADAPPEKAPSSMVDDVPADAEVGAFESAPPLAVAEGAP